MFKASAVNINQQAQTCVVSSVYPRDAML